VVARARVIVLLGIVSTMLLALPATATAAWRTSLQVDGYEASIEALATDPAGGVWAAGGSLPGGTFDAPTVWRHSASGWTAMELPVDLTGRWGFLSDVAASGPDDVWAVGHTTALRNGSALPLVGHFTGGSWRIVDHPWIAPSDPGGSFSAVGARSPADVWVAGVGAPGGTSEPVVWHFDGYLWNQIAVPIKNGHCTAGPVTIVGLALTADGTYLAFDCRTSILQQAGTVQRFQAGRWHSVLKLDSRQALRGLDIVAGEVWAVGSVSDDGTSYHGAAWSGGAAGLTRVPMAVAPNTLFRAAAGNDHEVYLAGERSAGGPGPYLLHRTTGDFLQEDVPYDRGFSDVALSGRGRAWLSGPVFGGWLGGTPPHARVLTRPPL
jgi:hypothetical protein